ncbi:hypothetical protein TCE0_060f19267 [Talaromyces pinophilus]|uniref:RNA-binding protein n=1 Tax=Talaromyces pinophilus TaxID=128442 RepID=A0A6V8HPM5_TALPI|nr:hypothetical protein TCE0_060f19267 [Talaromyces pinophilus]
MAHDNRYTPYRSSGYDDRDRDGRMYDDRYSRSRSVERGYPLHEDPTIRKIEIETTEEVAMTTAVHLRRAVVVADKQDTETAITKDTARQNTTIVAAEVPVAAGVVVETVTVIAIAEVSKKVEKLLWKDYRCVIAGGQISNELIEHYHVQGLEDVRVIRDRQTKISRQIGFLRFYSLNDSRAFIEQNTQHIYLYGRNPGIDDRGAKVRISYTRERDDRRGKPEGEWTCRNCSFDNFSTRQKCFRCQADRAEAEMAPEELPAREGNIGDNDVAPDNTPSQFLLFRGLDSSVTEEVFSKGVQKLYKPAADESQNTETGPKKAKVASTTGDSNLGAREGSLRRVLLVRDRRSNESWKFGFAEFATLEDAQAALVKLNSFEKFTIASRPVLASYIHAGVFVPVLNPTPSTARFTFSPLNNAAMKLAYWDEDGYVTELVVSTDDLDKKSKTDSKATKEGDKVKKRKAEASSSAGVKKMAVPSHLQFWSNRHAELHGIKKDEDGHDDAGRESDNVLPAAPPSRSYADLNRNCCYLCMRQFKSSAEVNRHERLSQLHRDNLSNEALVTKALAKLEKHKDDQPTTEYRDRAKERRQAFGSSRQTQAKPKPAAPVKQGIEEPAPAPAPSKGAALLSKMGWSEGSGLGAQGTGMTAPIATDVYAQGVGLGAQGSKLGEASEEAARNTRGRYDEFLEKTRDLARERYERMS